MQTSKYLRLLRIHEYYSNVSTCNIFYFGIFFTSLGPTPHVLFCADTSCPFEALLHWVHKIKTR